VPLALIEPLDKNEGAEAYRLLIRLSNPGPAFVPDEDFRASLRSLLTDAQQRYAARYVTSPTRGWELRADITGALTELHKRYGGLS
jgi:hypothetical protein